MLRTEEAILRAWRNGNNPEIDRRRQPEDLRFGRSRLQIRPRGGHTVVPRHKLILCLVVALFGTVDHRNGWKKIQPSGDASSPRHRHGLTRAAGSRGCVAANR